MARELSVVQKLTDTEALKVIDTQLQKGPRRTKGDEAEADEGRRDRGRWDRRSRLDRHEAPVVEGVDPLDRRLFSR